jgi:hypothetical protein
MTQGDYVKISSTTEVDAKMKHLESRIRGWNYQSPLTVKLAPFNDPTSLSQEALFNMWCREIADQMKKKAPDADAEAWKLWLKHKFLGTYAVKVGRETIEGQVYATPKGKAKMAQFMHSVLVYADDKLRVRLSVPRNSEYVKFRESKQAKEIKNEPKAGREIPCGSETLARLDKLEYVKVRENEQAKESKQKAKEEANHTAGSGKGSSATPKARSSKGEQQLGLL